MMNIFSVFLEGLKTVVNKFQLTIYLWLVNLVFSLAIIFPVFLLLKKEFAHSLIADQMLDSFSLLGLTDLVYKYKSIGPLIFGTLIIAVIVYLILAIFLNGALIGCLASPSRKCSMVEFMQNGTIFFARFLRLFLLSIPVYVLVIGLPLTLTGILADSFTSNAASEWPLLIFSNIKALLFILFFSLINMVFDYAKIICVQSLRSSVITAFLETLKFILPRWFKSWILYLLSGFLFLIASFAYLEIEQVTPGNMILLVVFVFILQQIYMMTRTCIRVNFYATQLIFYNQIKRTVQNRVNR